MRIKIKGATSQNIATTTQGIIDQFQVDLYEVNAYINSSKNGVPLIFVDEKEYQEVWLSSELDPQKKYSITKLNFGKFTTKSEQKKLLEKDNERRLRFEEIERLRKIGCLAVCEINNNFKIFETSKKPDKYFFNRKEKEGYKISLVIEI